VVVGAQVQEDHNQRIPMSEQARTRRKLVDVAAVVQVNLVVADLERSRAFYERLGMVFRARNRAGEGPAEAWVSTNTGTTVVLHSTQFASWWDELDLELDSVEGVDATVAALEGAGATIIKQPTDMPWRQRFAIVLDPDGHRIGLKAPRYER
jgi:catechol 2,3-dioxygenase-like lactoylglutathione lyase family enzyme